MANESALRARCPNSNNSENDVVTRLANAPNLRANFVAAAEYFDSLGDSVTSASLYNGVFPDWLADKYTLSKYNSVPASSCSSCERLIWYPPHTEDLRAILNADAKRNRVFHADKKKCLPEEVCLLANGSFVFDGTNKLFVDSNNTRLSDYSDGNSFLSHALVGDIANSSQYLSGLTVFLIARNARNFYHWHNDILPVFGLLLDCGISVKDIDNVVLDQNASRFQTEMLALLGISERQIKYIGSEPEHIRCEKIAIAKISNKMGMRQPRRHISWLRSSFLGGIDIRNRKAQSKITILRDNRGYKDPDFVSGFLEKRGYESVRLESLSYPEQVKIFHDASHIVSPHGAGLSLLAYSKPDTVVHEFYGEHIQPCFWSISSTMGHQYRNYNCSEISDDAITSSGRGLGKRLAKTVDVSSDVLARIDDL